MLQKKSIFSLVIMLWCGLWVCSPVGLCAQEAETFVVKKKKSGKAGSKSKENVCREFGQIAQTSAQVVEKVAKVQGVGLEHTAQYLEGEDPFAGMTKAQMQELERRSQALEQEMSSLCKHCDEYAQYQKKLFTQKNAS